MERILKLLCVWVLLAVFLVPDGFAQFVSDTPRVVSVTIRPRTPQYSTTHYTSFVRPYTAPSLHYIQRLVQSKRIHQPQLVFKQVHALFDSTDESETVTNDVLIQSIARTNYFRSIADALPDNLSENATNLSSNEQVEKVEDGVTSALNVASGSADITFTNESARIKQEVNESKPIIDDKNQAVPIGMKNVPDVGSNDEAIIEADIFSNRFDHKDILKQTTAQAIDQSNVNGLPVVVTPEEDESIAVETSKNSNIIVPESEWEEKAVAPDERSEDMGVSNKSAGATDSEQQAYDFDALQRDIKKVIEEVVKKVQPETPVESLVRIDERTAVKSVDVDKKELPVELGNDFEAIPDESEPQHLVEQQVESTAVSKSAVLTNARIPEESPMSQSTPSVQSPPKDPELEKNVFVGGGHNWDYPPQLLDVPEDTGETSTDNEMDENVAEKVTDDSAAISKVKTYTDIAPTIIDSPSRQQSYTSTEREDVTAPLIRPGVQTSPQNSDTAVQEEGKIEEQEEPEVKKSKYLIVKFKTERPYQLETSAAALFESGRPLQPHFSDASASVDTLNQKVGVKSINPLFQKRAGVSTAEAVVQRAQLSANVKQTYAHRQNRVPFDVQEPPPSAFVNVYRLEVPADSDLEAIAALYDADLHVEYAEPDQLMRAYYIPNDPYFWLQWGARNTGIFSGSVVDADIDVTEAWDLELGDGIVVAVNDSGVLYNHEDLAVNMWSNTDEVFNGTDSDGNGYVDDIRGWDFTTCAEVDSEDFSCIGPKSPDNDPYDDQGHGTHVAGTVGAVDNNVGVVGIAPEVQIMALKALTGGDGFGYTSHLAEAIVYAVDNGADVVNNSWGSNSAAQSVMVNTIAYARANGVLQVFSAGNEDTTVDPDSVCGEPGVICVGATTIDDTRLIVDLPGTENDWASNFGETVDLSAPGRWVYSTVIDDDSEDEDTPYNYKSGTSMAAPHVSGTAALLLAYHEDKNFTSDQVIEILKATTDDIGIPLFGTGRLNANRALLLDGLEPALNPIGDKTILTGDTLVFNVFASDPSDDGLTMSAALSGGDAVATIGANFVDQGDGAGLFTWTPPSEEADSARDIVFTVTDSPTLLTDTEVVTITVLAGDMCGNGEVEDDEECDDNNLVDGDGCTSECIEEVCGDGVINNDGAEECDDGGIAVGDGCNAVCQIEECGNGVVDFGEGCDDGNTSNGDGCNSLCFEEFCGDGSVNDSGAEQCDDGNILDGDGCTSMCLIEAVCGDGDVGLFEQCDDGNTSVGDGCNATCQLEECGNGTVDFGEECDDNNTTGGDGCSAICVNEFCGDGVINNDGAEQCDDGNTSVGDGCNATCQLEECGNGTVDFGEECDDGNTISGDGCTAVCVVEFCGDGIVNNAGSEECDDANDNNEDGCWDNCEIHGFCGDGSCDIIEGENCGSCQTDCGYCRGLRPRS